MHKKTKSLTLGMKVAMVVGGSIFIVLGAISFLNNSGGSSSNIGQEGKYAFAVGKPDLGQVAPPIKLLSTDGRTFDLTSLRGKTVLLYFQEGITCQPCWDQIKDIEAKFSQFQSLGVDKVVSITTDPLDVIKQKVADEHITTPVLSDPSLSVSQAYNANSYGMMGKSRDGHSFVIVGPDGRIRWRADYGGAPNYTMYVPVMNLIPDIRAGLKGASN